MCKEAVASTIHGLNTSWKTGTKIFQKCFLLDVKETYVYVSNVQYVV